MNLKISIQDTGVGIPEDQQALIFESFRQQDGQSTRKYGGTGLGLTISKRLVEMMNGCISVKSEKGKGSEFIITFDAKVSDSVPVLKDIQHIDINMISFETASVMVVDDIAYNRILIKEYLAQTGLQIIEAEDGQKALFLINEFKPDLIFMDLRMPVMDGFEATRKLKENPATKDIPIIAITASVTTTEQELTKKIGFDGYLSKPIVLEALLDHMLRHLKYRVKENLQHEKAVAETDPKSTEEKIEDIEELILTLENKSLPRAEQLKDILEMDEVEGFAQNLLEIGVKHKVESLCEFAEKLAGYAHAFDIRGINDSLRRFPAIVSKYRKIKE